jgi:hypothetical protein
MHFDAVEWSNPVLETVALWPKANDAAAVGSYQPPAETVRMVKEAFATAGLAGRPRETGDLIELLFDNFSDARPAGIRSAARGFRQMLYRAGSYQIDIQLETQPERNRLVVAGQLLDVSHPEGVGREVQVRLSDGRESVVKTMTNQFGEFRGEVENSGDLELSFFDLSGKPIVIMLRQALDQA